MKFYKLTKDVYIQFDRINYVRVAGFSCWDDGIHRYDIQVHYIDDVLNVALTRAEWIEFQKEMEQYT
jgi:hypothetical protein